MEASVAQGTEGQGSEEQGGPDFSPLMERMDQIAEPLGQVVTWIQSQQQDGDGEEGDDYADFINGLFGGQEGEQGGQEPGLSQQEQAPQVPQFLQDPQLFQQLLDRAVERGVEQRVGPRLEAFENDRFQRQVADLLEELPGLQDPQAQQDTMLAAQEIAHEMGQPEAWRHPAFFRMAYLARLAEQRSGAEVPADASGGEARLEGGSGANPGQSDGPNLAEQILQAHRGSQSDFKFW